MIDAKVDGDDLEVVVTGADSWILALRPRWSVQVPLENIKNARADAPRQIGQKRYMNTATRQRTRGRLGTLLCAHFRAPTLRVDLDEDGPYRQIILSVPHPERAKSFYQKVFELQPSLEEDTDVMFRLENLASHEGSIRRGQVAHQPGDICRPHLRHRHRPRPPGDRTWAG